MRSTLLAAIAVLLCVFSAFPQADANKAQLSGTVTDPSGSAVAAAAVKITNTATGFVRETQTGSDGVYRAVQLDPGAYEVTITSQGFSPTTLKNVVLNVGSTANFDVRLEVSGTEVSIEVSETLINIALPAPTTTLTGTAIRDLPINGRRFQDFAAITPTVQVEPQRQQLSFAGQRGVNSNIMVDGADYNQPFFGGIRGGERSNFNFTLPQSAVQEFQAVATGYAAEYGRSTGGVLNVITKTGGNEWHGDGFYQNRNRELSRNNPIFLRKPSETLQQWGGSVGGPLKRERLFLFGAYEQQKADTPREVFFGQLAGLTATDATREALEFFRSQQVPFKQDNRAVASTVRSDYQFANGSRLTLRYNFSDSVENNAVSVGGALNPFTNAALSNEGTEKNRTHFGTAQLTSLFGARVVNDLKFSTTYEVRPRLANSESPTVSAGVIGAFGARSFLPTIQDDTRIQVTDSLSILAGRHSIKFGVDYSHLKTFQTFGFNQFGSFSIAGANVAQILDILGTGGTIPNRFDSTAVTYTRQIGNLIADFKAQQMAFFVQDSWRVSSNFTLDLGLRWEGQYNPAVEANNTALVNRIQGVVFPNNKRLDVTKIPDVTNQWAPRAGFAYRPLANSNRLVIRAHSGLFYAATPLLLYSGATNNFRIPPGDVSLQLTPIGSNTVYQQLRAAGVDLNTSSLGALPVIPVEVVQRASALALGGTGRDPFVGANVTTMAPDFRNPRSFQYGIGADWEIMDGFVAGVQYNYVNSVWLHRNAEWNRPFPTIRANDASRLPFYGLRSGRTRWIPEVGQVTVRQSDAQSMFRGVTFQTQYRGRKFQWGAFYTVAEAFSDDDSERDAGGVNHVNPLDFRPEYNYSSLDIRHQFNTYGLYRLPWGFEVSGVLRMRSGLPLDARTGADTNEDLQNNDRPLLEPGVYMPRNFFRNRKFINNDLRVLKSFRLKGENVRVQLSAEFFNLFNVDNVVFGNNARIFGLGLTTAGTPAPVDSRFQRLRNAQGGYDAATTQQLGNPFQAQFGIRFFF